MSIRQVEPGRAVSDDIIVSVPPPDPCWVLELKNGAGAAVAQDTGCIYVFSSEKHLQAYAEVRRVPMNEYTPIAYAWNDLVAKCKRCFPGATIDHAGAPGFYRTIRFTR
jgi:hypothetical protein